MLDPFENLSIIWIINLCCSVGGLCSLSPLYSLPVDPLVRCLKNLTHIKSGPQLSCCLFKNILLNICQHFVFDPSGQLLSSKQRSPTAVTPSSWMWCPGSVCQRGKGQEREWWSCSSPYWSLLMVKPLVCDNSQMIKDNVVMRHSPTDLCVWCRRCLQDPRAHSLPGVCG